MDAHDAAEADRRDAEFVETMRRAGIKWQT